MSYERKAMSSRLLIILLSVVAVAVCVSINLHSQTPPRTYVGSTTCGDCHQTVYQRWTKTRMANVVTDPKVRPKVIIPDLSRPEPLFNFKAADIAHVSTTSCKQQSCRR